MNIAIATDSNSGIFEEQGKKLDVHVMPMPVLIDEQTFYEGRTLTPAEFYKAQAAGRKVSTSQPSPGYVLDFWDSLLEEKGYDHIIYIPMSSGLSSSCATAQMLARSCDGRVTVVDNHRISVTQRISATDAVALRNAGCSPAEIREELERTGLDACIFIGMETLKYLKQGGRITPAVAAMGTIMGIKPVMTLAGDKVDAYAKPRGTANARKKITEAVKKCAEDFDRRGISYFTGTAGSFMDPADAEEWRLRCKELIPDHEPCYDSLTCSIGCHTGPEAYGMGLCRKLII